MSKVHGPLFSLKAHGKLADSLIYQSSAHHSSVYKYHKPTGIASGAQWTQRRFVEFVLAQWIGMSQADKDAWKAEAKKYHSDLPAYHYFLKRAHQSPYTVCGLCAYWSFNEPSGATALDYSPNENNGTLKPTYPTDCPTRSKSKSDKFDKAMIFNGSNDYIDCATPPTLNFGAQNFTLAFWFKTNNAAQTQYFVTKQSNGYKGYGVYIQSSKFWVVVNDGIVGTTWVTTYTVNAQQWYYITLIKENDLATLYVNAENIGSKTSLNQGNIDVANNLTIGKASHANDFYLNGTIDEVRILNRVMTADEIKFLYSKDN